MRLFSGLALGLLLVSLVAMTTGIPPTNARERTPTPTPTPTPTEEATPLPSLPAAPSDVRILGGVLTWIDNSDNEDGFEIKYYCNGEPVFSHRVPANTTRYEFPPDEKAFIREGCARGCTQIVWEVIPFNAQGMGQSGMAGRIIECVVPGEPSTLAPPDTGRATGEIGRASPSGTLLALVGAGGALLAAGFALRQWAAKRR